MSTLHVACSVEGNYVAHSAAMLHSLLTCNRDVTVHVHYMHGPDFPSPSGDLLAGMVDDNGGKITFHRIPDERCIGLPTRGFTGKATWYRIFLPELLPDIDRVINLDVDLIVLDSLLPLWRIDLGDHYVAAVTNVFERHYMHRPKDLGLDGPEVYFNAGVLVMNLDLMRRDGCSGSLLEYGVKHRPQWRDQDALNVILGNRRLSLHPRWNLMNSMVLFPWSDDVFGAGPLNDARRNPAIRHFEGPSVNKPWHYLCERDMRELYAAHRTQTPWPNLRPDGLTPRNVIKRLSRDVRQRITRNHNRGAERDALTA